MIGRFLAIILCFAVLGNRSSAQHSGSEPSKVRKAAVEAGRQCVLELGGRLVPPVWLDTDSLQELADGFSEALLQAGISPRLATPESQTGTHVIVRVVPEPGQSVLRLSVRAERLGDRAIIYSRMHEAGGADGTNEGPGFMDGILVPVVAGVTAAILVYLLFTVRS